MFCLHVCICTTCVSGASRGQKRVSDPVELELQMLLSYHVGSGKQNLDPLYKQQVLLTRGCFSSPSTCCFTPPGTACGGVALHQWSGRPIVGWASYIHHWSRKCPTVLSIGRANGDIFSTEVPSSKMILAVSSWQTQHSPEWSPAWSSCVSLLSTGLTECTIPDFIFIHLFVYKVHFCLLLFLKRLHLVLG